jgi:hypothetical protein
LVKEWRKYKNLQWFLNLHWVVPST